MEVLLCMLGVGAGEDEGVGVDIGAVEEQTPTPTPQLFHPILKLYQNTSLSTP
jgi:hypothetical protein